jgi:hypothetical protein
LCLNVFLPKDTQISEGGEADCEYLKLLSGSSRLDHGISMQNGTGKRRIVDSGAEDRVRGAESFGGKVTVADAF